MRDGEHGAVPKRSLADPSLLPQGLGERLPVAVLPEEAWPSFHDLRLVVAEPDGTSAAHPHDPVREARQGAPGVDMLNMHLVRAVSGPHGPAPQGGGTQLFHVQPLLNFPVGHGLFLHQGTWWYLEAPPVQGGSPEGWLVGHARPATPDEIERRHAPRWAEPEDGAPGEDPVQIPDLEDCPTNGVFAHIDLCIRADDTEARHLLADLTFCWHGDLDPDGTWPHARFWAKQAMLGRTIDDVVASLRHNLATRSLEDLLEDEAPEPEDLLRDEIMRAEALAGIPAGKGVARPDLTAYFDSARALDAQAFGNPLKHPLTWMRLLRQAQQRQGRVSDLAQAYAKREGFPFPGTAENTLLRWGTCLSSGSTKHGCSYDGWIFGRHDIVDSGNTLFLFGEDPMGRGTLVHMSQGRAGTEKAQVRVGVPCPLGFEELCSGLARAKLENGRLVGALACQGGRYRRFLILGGDPLEGHEEETVH